MALTEKAKNGITLASIAVIIGALLIIWIVTYDTSWERDTANAKTIDFPFGQLKDGFRQISDFWKDTNLFGQDETAPEDPKTDQQGTFSNAGLTNEEIKEIEKPLFKEVAPQDK